ncbi:DNA translocase FtsK, partial [Candidatus Tokpelaia sp.]|uniref:DNA translocase FtsK n=1 Tax=Candidatus Tokpelaia sp. TaxID=2233777 RepID=UPI00210F42B6
MADNVRFTRTPDSEIIRRRAAIDPVYAKILAEAEAAKAAYRQRREAEERALPPAEAAGTEVMATINEVEPAAPAALAAGAAAAAVPAFMPEMPESAEENMAALPEHTFHEADADRDCGSINQGYETIEQMRGFATAAFGGAPARTSAAEAAVLPEAEPAPAPRLSVNDRQEAAVLPAENSEAEIKNAAKTVSCPENIFPWTMKADKVWAAPLLAGSGRAASDEKEREPAEPAAPAALAAGAAAAAAPAFTPEVPPVAKQIDVIRLFKSMECRQPQMRWIPVPAHMAQTLAADSLSPTDQPALPAEAGKAAANADIFAGFARQSRSLYPTAHPEAGHNKNNTPSVNFAAAQPPTLNLQFKLGGYNSAQDSFIWEHIQTAPAPLTPQNQEKGAREANLDALCTLAVEQTGKAAAAPLPAAAEESIAAAPPQAAAMAEQREIKAGRAEPLEMPAGRPAQPKTEARYSYRLPSLELLQEPVYHEENIISQESLERSAGLLENVLEDFGVRGEIIHVRPGPVVTLYEFEPAPGVKSSRVIGLSDDIARSMSAIAARVAVIPGRNVIGIELPNKKRETVYLREILQSGAYKTSDYKLPLALGKNIGGEPIIAELAKMPHLLVAGTTGSGKSVAINTMILSL